ncbi:MAG: hypothetical protein ACN6ON_05765 [Sphingobacterium sp.]
MKYVRAKGGFIRMRDAEMLLAVERIMSCIKNNALFPAPVPSLAKISEAHSDYHDTILAAANGGKYYRAARRESKECLAKLMQQLVHYVNIQCDGDLVKLYQSGFPVLSEKKVGKAPDMPTSAYLRDGRVSGEVAFGFTPVGRDMLYGYCFATGLTADGEPLWSAEEKTSRSFRAYKSGFEIGQQVYFRVRAYNKHGESNWTAAVMLRVR